MKAITVTDREAGQRLDKLLGKYLNLAGRGFLCKMMRKKNITLNGKKCDGTEKLSIGDEIKLFLADETIEKFTETQIPRVKKISLDIIYEDDHVLLVNKPAGMLSQKASAKDESLTEYVTDYLLNTGALTEEDLKTFRPGVCNRLDRNTSGLVVAGKSLAGLQIMAEIFKDRSIHKYYYCFVSGKVSYPQTIRGFLEKDCRTNQVKIYESSREKTAEIVTEYSPVFYIAPRETGGRGYTLLRVTLITGRTHQIRAHLASIGHPLVGDCKYGNKNVNEEAKKRYGIRRPMLHSFQAEFPDLQPPLTYLSGRTFSAPLPEDFKKLLGAERTKKLLENFN